jgi:methyltransferase family protein
VKDTDLISEFRNRYNKSIVPVYHDRETRNRWAASLLEKVPGNEILNLGGGGKRHLEKYLGSKWRVHELDIAGDCDTRLNLDEIDRLPFEDNSFDTCCAFDVLEHLDKFHLIADEMFRVTRTTILISLPNAAVELYPICRNRRDYNNPLENGVYSKFYGLPLKAPEDRHRWWLTFEDIVRYCLWYEQTKSCVIEFFIPNNEYSMKRKLFRLIAGERLFLNLFCYAVWIKITK